MNEQAKETDNIDKASSHDVAEAGSLQSLAKIEPIKVSASQADGAEHLEAETSDVNIREASLLEATRNLLKSHGIRKSAASGARSCGDAA
jgi:hypothetical protein